MSDNLNWRAMLKAYIEKTSEESGFFATWEDVEAYGLTPDENAEILRLVDECNREHVAKFNAAST